MTHDRRPAVATILAMSALVLEKAADDLAAGQLDPDRARVLSGAMGTVAVLLRDHATTAGTRHLTICPPPTTARPIG